MFCHIHGFLGKGLGGGEGLANCVEPNVWNSIGNPLFTIAPTCHWDRLANKIILRYLVFLETPEL